ncbi:MAG: hypothetical protein ABIF85_04860 [Nanoarchaeota archaeon]|nr:hypothetical protein [Nanoarchaeota archaeon]MBU4452218.1 hypothetical protein [Nanoarchaeota archaeon]
MEKSILDDVAERIKIKAESLIALKTYEGQKIGFEGWFKVEVIAALSKYKVEIPHNKGPDLSINFMDNETPKLIELKCKNEFTPTLEWIRDGILYYRKKDVKVDMCLFLLRAPEGNEEKKSEEMKKMEAYVNKKYHLKIVSMRNINDDWIVGILK